MVKYRNLIKIEYMKLTGRFLAHPFASLRVSARNDKSLQVTYGGEIRGDPVPVRIASYLPTMTNTRCHSE